MEKDSRIIKINFCNMYKGFDVHNNYFVNVIDKYFGGYEISEEPDFLIYSCFGVEHHKYKNKRCVKIFYTAEALSPNFTECDYAIGFDNMSFGSRYCRRPVWLFNNIGPGECTLTDEQALNRKFCNFVYSNASNGWATKLRMDFAQKLMEYKPVDCPGKVLNNMSSDILTPRDGDWQKGKLEFLKDYKFTIAFENCDFDGYTTEKLLDPLVAHSIPIYWGNPSVSKDFNPKSFICANGYENRLDDLVKRVVELDNDDSKYLEMLRTYPMADGYNPQEFDELETFLVNIFQKGNSPYDKDPRGFVRRMSFEGLGRKDKIKFLLLKR